MQYENTLARLIAAARMLGPRPIVTREEMAQANAELRKANVHLRAIEKAIREADKKDRSHGGHRRLCDPDDQ